MTEQKVIRESLIAVAASRFCQQNPKFIFVKCTKIEFVGRYIGKIFLKVRHGAYSKIKSRMEWDRRSSRACDIDTILVCIFEAASGNLFTEEPH